MTDFRPRAGYRHTGPVGGLQGRARAMAGIWHRPALLDLISDILMLASAVALGYALVAWFLSRPLFPLREVVLLSQPRRVTVEQVEYAARSLVRGNFFSVDLDDIRIAFEKLPWVRYAEVRRRWPNAIELTLEEQQAVAYWSAEGSDEINLVNDDGEVFVAASDDDMPALYGPQGSAAYMLQRYHRFSEQLQPLGRQLSGLWLSAREAWQLRLDDGVVILLGRDQARSPIEERLARFVKVWPETQEKTGMQVAIADLRYQGGFALTPVVEMKTVKGRQ